VTFTAPVNGTTTSGSKYPRSELREMTNNGLSNASWSATNVTVLQQATGTVRNMPGMP
jgi:hypothetical protein